jgi:hypothetical protein
MVDGISSIFLSAPSRSTAGPGLFLWNDSGSLSLHDRPLLTWSIQQNGNARQDIPAKDSSVAVDDKVSAPKDSVLEYHVKIHGSVIASASVEAYQLIFRVIACFQPQTLHGVARQKRYIGSGIDQE